MLKMMWMIAIALLGLTACFANADKHANSLEIEAYKSMDKIPPRAERQKHLLCAVFLNIESDASISVLRENMKQLNTYCEFAVISYKCSIHSHFKMEAIAKESGAKLAMYRCVRPDTTSITHVSKPMLYDRLLPLLPLYERVWFLDEDLSVDQDFDMNGLLQTLDCAFWPRPAPMIIQPTIIESNQDYNFANWKTFDGTGIIAHVTDFVEIQMPLFNSSYLDWFIRHIVRPSASIMKKEKTQFLCAGLDSMFCRSAKSFAKKTYHDLNASYTSCAVVTAPHTGVHHMNMKTIPKDQGDFFNSTNKQAHLLQKYFPSFMWWWFKKNDQGKFQSPHWSEWESVTSLPTQCPLRNFQSVDLSSVGDAVFGPKTAAATAELQGNSVGAKQRRNRQIYRKAIRNLNKHHINSRAEKTRLALKKLRKENKNNRTNEDAFIQSLDKAYVGSMTKLYALHFPQFHSDKLNNKIWGEKFSDWENLISAPTENREGNPLLFPTEMGLYDLMEPSVRKTEADLAREYGIDGFIYHHYFFYEAGLGATLSAPLEAMLVDGEPDLPFAFHWANQQWTATWQGKGLKEGELLQAQNYPDPSDPLVVEHYNFLKRFFHHKNYILIDGVPLFMVFQTFDVRCHPILKKLRELAIADGFPEPGLHIPQFRVNIEHPINKDVIPLKMRNTRVTIPGFDSDAYYPSNHNFKGNMIPAQCRRGHRSNETRPVYLSTLTSFDNTPRRDFETATVWDRRWSKLGVVKSFERDLVETMFYDMCCQDPVARAAGGGFMMINAWNEWAEGMVLEPSNIYGRQFLEAVYTAKRIMRKIRCSLPLYELYHRDVV